MTNSTAWNYDNTLFSTSTANANTMIVRRLIGDVLSNDRQLSDNEIAFAVSQYSNLYLAAAEAARWIAMQYARQVDLVTGELKTNYSQRSRQYRTLAADLQNRGVARGGVIPYAGGLSVTDKQSQEDDPDRVVPNFNLGMTDNTLPTGIVGHENPGNPEDTGSQV